MKKISLLALLFLTILTLNANDLVKYAPKSSSILFNLNLKKALAVKLVKEFVEDEDNNDMAELKKDLAKYNLKIENLADDMLFFADVSNINEPSYGLLAKTDVKESVAKNIIADQCKSNNIKMKTEKVDNKQVYSFSGDVSSNLNNIPVGAPVEDDYSITYLKDNVVLLTGQNLVKGYLANLAKGIIGKSGKPSLISGEKLNQSAILWGAVNVAQFVPQNDPSTQGTPQGMPAPQKAVKSGTLSLDVAGAKKEDILVNIDLLCTDAKNANSLAMQLQMGAAMMAMQMNDNPQLANDLNKSIKIKPAGDKLNIAINLKKATLDQLAAYKDAKGSKAKPVKSITAPPAPPKPAKVK